MVRFLSGALPGLNSPVNVHNLSHASIKTPWETTETGWGDTQVAKKQEIQPTADVVCMVPAR